MFIDGAGNQIGKVYSADAPISDCTPVIKDGKVVYYASNANMFNIYTINPETGAFSKKALRVAGPNATWNIKDGVLTISGTGPIEIDPGARSRYTLSSTSSVSVYSSSDNAWKLAKESVTKINIAKGITAIPDEAFKYFNKLNEVKIADGLVSIGKEAFSSCASLKSVYIPDSVTSIGDDIVWTGSYWISDHSHVTNATIYANCTSYAAKYARENSIRYVSPHAFETGFTVDIKPTCTEEGSKSRHCSLCGEKTDVTDIPANGHDYKLGIIKNGQADAECKVCGDKRKVNVPTGVSVFWRNESSESKYYYPNPAYLQVDEKIYAMIEPVFSGDDNQLDEFIVDTGVEKVRAFGFASFSYSKPGAYLVKVYSRYRPEICETYTIKVLDESGNVPEDPKEDDQITGDKASSEALVKGATASEAERAITSLKSDNDPAGSKFAPLKLKSTKQTKSSITLKWTKVKGAKRYVIYGNKCGKSNKPKKLVTLKSKYSKKVIKKVAGKKLKKGTYYKFIVVALDSSDHVISTSRIIHAATKGRGNHTKVTVSKKVRNNKLTLRKGKNFKLGAKAIGKNVKKHVGLRYESSNTNVAKVSKSGKITAKKKGRCYVYAYAQNGVFAKIRVTVK